MSEGLLSVGLDVGTTSTQMIVSRLQVENRASGFAVPKMEITRREILYESPVHFTPLLDESHVDGAALRQLVEAEYKSAGIRREDVNTGAVIITGETSRKENARTVLESLADFAGEFVVTTAGPDLESVLAAKGAGAVDYSQKTGKTVLHFDIGGGTSNWALIKDGIILRTGCLNVGGRLVKFREDGKVTYVSPVLEKLTDLRVGDKPSREQVEILAQTLTRALEMAAGLREATPLLEKLVTKESTTEDCGNLEGIATAASGPRNDSNGVVYSFSGGVADCIDRSMPWLCFGDMGPLLGQAIRKSRLCQHPYRLGEQTIRATVIGAGCHSAQLSGSTVFYKNVRLPLKDLTAVTDMKMLRKLDLPGILALPGIGVDGYGELVHLADEIAAAIPDGPVYVAAEADMAKALGHLLALRLEQNRPILCLDRISLRMGDYLDVGEPVGPALPVVVKTLIFGTPQ